VTVPFTRRKFVTAATAAAAGAVLVPGVARGAGKSPLIHVPRQQGARDPELNALAARAVEAARSAGASYADARLTVTRSQVFYGTLPAQEGEERAFGVRVLVGGFWGFLASAVWTPDEAARLATGAVAQARAHSRGATRTIDLGPAPKVANGTWVMPVKYDPFDVPIGEKLDVMNHFHDYTASFKAGVGANSGMNFMRQVKVFASSDGASWTQTVYRSQAGFSVGYMSEYHASLGPGGATAEVFSYAGRGWEHISESGLIDAIPRLVDEAEQSRHVVPVEVGRFDMVFSAAAMASLLDQTIGPATELDRAMGYEANAEGTSYLSEPLEMLGTYQVGSPLLTVKANRTLPGGAATVKWDDEGVEAEESTLVDKGILTDFQTTREQAAWLAPYYQRTGKPVRSRGCAGAESAMDVTIQHAPNLVMMPGAADISFDDMVAGTKKGIAVLSISSVMDQQSLNGMGRGAMREIDNGKLGKFIRGGAIVFRAPEFWRSLAAIGGAKSSMLQGHARGKGQPRQTSTHSVAAVPGKATQVAIIDALRKA
jgi:TldD protein